MRLPDIGELFEGRYELLDILGEGAFARVYRAADRSVDRVVALKILAPKHGEYRGVVGTRFLREARLLAELQDPHTITMFDHGESPDGLLWMACEFVDGEDLRERLFLERRLPPPVVRQILLQLLSSLREAHSKGLLHRDIKPANILVHEYAGDPYRVKLLDFGLAKSVDVNATQVTREGKVTGTPRYMSPEQVIGGTLGPPSDLYSLGLVAYELLTGKPAIEGETTEHLLRAQILGPPILIPPEDAPAALRRVIEKMVERDLDRRYRTAAEVRRELKAVRFTDGLRAPPAPTAPAQLASTNDVPTPETPQPRMATASTEILDARARWPVVVVVVVAILGVLIALWPQAPAPPPVVEGRRSAVALLKPAAPQQTAPAPADAAVVVPMAADVGTMDAEPTRTTSTTHSKGCGKRAPFDGAGRLHGTLTYLPKSYDADVPHPLLVVLHADLAGPTDLLAGSDLVPVADEHGLVISLPSYGGAVEARVWRNVPESVEFIEKTQRQVRRATCIDESRIFVVMDGDGGRASRGDLLCRRWVRGFAVNSYLPTAAHAIRPCDKVVPEMWILPADSMILPLDGTATLMNKARKTVDEMREDLFVHHRCEGEPRPARHPHCQTWQCDSPAQLCVVPGGFGWIHGGWSPLMGETPGKFPRAAEIWRFFRESAP